MVIEIPLEAGVCEVNDRPTRVSRHTPLSPSVPMFVDVSNTRTARTTCSYMYRTTYS